MSEREAASEKAKMLSRVLIKPERIRRNGMFNLYQYKKFFSAIIKRY